MNKMKKMAICLVSLICVVVMAAGCHANTFMSYTFSIDNGDSIKIKLNTNDKFKISSEVPFTISQNGETMMQGSFIQGEAYSQYAQVVEQDEKAQLLDSGKKDGNEYIFWCYDGKEYNYAVLVGGSNTGVLLGSTVSEEVAKDCFSRLTISPEK